MAKSAVLRRSLLALAFLAMAPHAIAATYTWDNGTQNLGGPTDGSGTWSTGSNWWNSSGYQAWNNSTFDTAQFGFSSGNTQPYTVTLNTSGETAGGIIFQDQSYTLSGGPLTLGGAAPTITVNASGGTISSTLVAASGFTKSGTGTLDISGGQVYSGATVISGGVLQLKPGAYTPPTGTQAFYQFSNSGSLGQDTSGNNHTLSTASGAPAYSSVGLFGGSVSLNGASTMTTSGFPTGVPTGNSTYTIALWEKANGSANNGGFVGWGNNSGSQSNNFRLSGPNALNNYWYGNDYNLTGLAVNPMDGNWHFVAVTYNGSTRTMYVDGVQVGSLASSGNNAQATNFVVGKTTADVNFTGNIENLLISNQALSQSALLGVMNESVLPVTTTVTISPNSTLDLNGVSQPILALSDATPGSAGSVINSNTSTASVLTLSPTGSATFSGAIQSGGTLGTISLVIAGTGTQVLAGSGGFTGTTTISAGALQLASTSALSQSTVTVSAANGLSFALGTTASIIGGLSGGSNFSLQDSGAHPVTLTVGNNASSTTYTGVLSGSGGLTKVGSGTLTLGNGSQNNTISGVTTINGGILALAGGVSSLNNAIVVNSGGTLQWNNANLLGESASVTLNGGVANLNGNRDYWGGNLTLSNNALVLGTTASTCWFITDQAGSLIVGTGGGNAGTIASTVVLASVNASGDAGNRTQTVQVSPSTTLTISGVIENIGEGSAEVGSLTETGGGVLILSNTDTYTGLTTISAGTLQLGTGAAGQNGSLATSGIADNSALVYNLSGSQTVGYSISGAGSLSSIAGATKLTSTANSFAGNLVVNGGTLQAATANAVANPATTVLGNTQLTSRTITVNNGGTLQFTAANVMGLATLQTDTVATPIAINAGGTVTNTSGGNNILGNVVLSGGTLTGGAGASGTLYTWQLSTGSVTVNTAPSVMTGSGANTGFNMAQSTTFNVAATGGASPDLTVSAPLGDVQSGFASASLIKTGNGSMLLSASNTYTGNTTVSGGTLALGGGSGNNIPNSPAITVGSGATLDTTGLSGGALTLGATQTLTGIGTVNGDVTTAPNSSLTPGSLTSIGALTTGNLNLSSGGNLNFVLGTAGTSAASTGLGSSINVNGSLTLPATQIANLNLLNNNGANGQGSIGSGYYDLFNYAGSLAGSPSAAFGTGSGAKLYNYSTVAGSPNELVLQISVATFNWTGLTGGTGAADSNWNVTSTNWANAANNAATSYADGAVVIFGDTNLVTGGSISNANITLGSVFAPTSITFSNSAVNYSITGVGGITGATGIVLSGTGAVTLGTSNSFTSPVQVNAGALTITNAAALGNASQASVASGGALQIQGGINANPVPLTLNGAGYAASPAGALNNLGGANSYPGAITLGSSTAIDSSSGTLTLSGGVANSGNLLMMGGAGAINVTAPISGAGGLLLAGPGNITLSATNTYGGATTVNGGTLTIGAPNPLPFGANAGNVSVSGAATLNLFGNTLSINGLNGAGTIDNTSANPATLVVGNNNASGTVSGVIQNSNGNLTLQKTGSGTLIVSNTNNTYAGGTTVNGGLLNVAGDGALGAAGGTVTFTNNATLQFAGPATLNASRGVSISSGATATLDTQGNAVTIAGAISGAGNLAVPGNDQLLLTSALSNLGGTLTQSGSSNLTITGAMSLGALTESGSSSLALAGGLTVGGAYSQTGSGSLSISGTGSLASATTVTIGAAAGDNLSVSIAGGVLSSNATGAGSMVFSNVNGATTIANMTSGAINSAGELFIGNNGTGVFNLSGGTMTTNNWIALGRASTTGFGVLNLSGSGTVVHNAVNSVELSGDGGNGNSIINQSGNSTFQNNFGSVELGPAGWGLYTASGGTANFGSTTLGNLAAYGVGILTVSGSANVNAGGITLGGSTNGSGQVNLNGGVLSTTQITAVGSGTDVVNLNGGTLTAATGAQSTFTSNLTTMNVGAGGATINTNGQNITIAASLAAPAGNGVQSISASGNGYVATPVVKISGGGGSGATAEATVNAGGNLTGITVTNPGTGYTSPPTVSVIGANGTLISSASATLNGGNTSGGLTVTGGGMLTISNHATYRGPTVVSSGTLQLSSALPAGTAAYYAFNNPNNLGADTSGNGNNLTASGNPLYSSTGALPGQGSVSLNGSSSFSASTFPVNVPTGSSPYTIGLWEQTTSSGTSGGFIGFGTPSTVDEGNNLRLSGSNGLDNYWFTNDMVVTGLSTNLEDGNWHYIAVTWNGSTQTMYVDGVAVSSDTRTGLDVIPSNFVVGKTLNDADFTGSMDDLLVANQALSQAQIDALMQGLNNLLPVTTSVTVAPGAAVDLGGVSQRIASLSDATPGNGGAVINSNTSTVAVLTLSPTTAATFSGSIQGSGTLGTIGLAMVGPGSQVLAGANSYTGGTQITGGLLQLGNATALGTGAVTANGGTLDLHGNSVLVGSFGGAAGIVTNNASSPAMLTTNQSSATTFSGTIADGPMGSVALTMNGSGDLTLTASNAYSGGTNVNAGVVAINNAAALGSGSVNVNAGGRVELSGNITMTQNLAIAGNGSSSDGSLFGALRSTSGTNTWAGNIVLSDSNSRVGTTTNSAVLILSGSITSAAPGDGLWIRSADNTAGLVIVTGAGLYQGATDVITGTLQSGGNNVFATSYPLAMGNTNGALNIFDLAGWSQTFAGLQNGTGASNFGQIINSGSNASTITLNQSGASTFSGTIQGNIALVNAGGIQMLAASNSYSGGTTIGGGTLQVVQNALGGANFVNIGPGTLDVVSNIVSGRNVNLTDPAATIQVESGVSYYNSGLISGSGGLTKTGAGLLTVAGTANTYSGTTTVNAGTLQLVTAGALGTGGLAANGGVLDLDGNSITAPSFSGAGYPFAGGVVTDSSASAGTTTLTVNQAGSTNFGGSIQNGPNGQTLALSLASGKLTLGGANNTYSGATSVSGGALVAAAAGAFSPNSAFSVTAGTLDASSAAQSIGSLSMGTLGTLNLGVGNFLSVANAASLAGTLNIFGFSGGSEELMSYGSETGTFGTVNGLTGNYLLSYGSNQLDIVAPAPSGPPTWLGGSGLSWTTSANWSTNSVPSGIGATAIVGAATGSSVTITLDAPQTLGNLTFTNTASSVYGYTLAPGVSGSLTLDNSGSAAQIVVASGAHAIAAPVNLVGGDLMVSASNDGTLTISGNITDDNGMRNLFLTGDGTGTLVLSGTNTFGSGSGTTTVAAGTLVLANNEALADGMSLIVGDASLFGGIQPAGYLRSGSASASVGANAPLAISPTIAPVPEPSTIVLLASGAAALVVCSRRRWRLHSRRGALLSPRSMA